MVIAQECVSCGEVFEEHSGGTCPFCKGKVEEIVELMCNECGEVFEGMLATETVCPICESINISEV
jgi:rubrerythrin